ncbi:unnamed protein product, partial [Amoebophrya sp. A120]
RILQLLVRSRLHADRRSRRDGHGVRFYQSLLGPESVPLPVGKGRQCRNGILQSAQNPRDGLVSRERIEPRVAVFDRFVVPGLLLPIHVLTAGFRPALFRPLHDGSGADGFLRRGRFS